MSMSKGTILLVEDDHNLGFVIKDNLEISGFAVTHCADGEQAWTTWQQQAFDLCILDIMLPKKDGITLATSIREKDEMTPILFLTAKSMKEDKIAGFRAGADDYVTKPFSIEELLLRIDVFLKRSRMQKSMHLTQHIFDIGRYTFDHRNLSLHLDEQVRTLTQKEADILRYLCMQKGQVARRNDILNKVWGNDDYFLGRSLDVFISKLRKYLKADEQVEIVNYHGIGFKLTDTTN